MENSFDPAKIFLPDFYTRKGDAVRSASGKPGSAYWQNEADYKVEATFDPESKLLKGKVVINYKNNSPDELDFLWLQLDQNTVNSHGRRNEMLNPTATPDNSKGYKIQKVVLTRNGKSEDADFTEMATRMQIPMKKYIQPGEEIQLTIDYSFVLQPRGGGGRSGYMDTPEGTIYEVSYWYPRMNVYDDYYGWNTLPFIGGGEMYLDYGDVDYKLTVPSNQVVVGSGELINGEEILNEKTLKRLKQASESDKTVMIRSAKELKDPVTRGKSKTTTWHFKMKNTRDVAWAMSTAYIWDAARVNLSEGKKALAQSVYPVQSTKEDRAWARSTEMLKFSTEFFSEYLIDYPYPVATSVAGVVGGMEFPALVFNHWDVKAYDMFLLASHEIGHTWFPMIVGSDERRNPFMDEGLNVFMDIYAHEAFNNGEFAPKRDGEYAPKGGNPNDEIVELNDEIPNGPFVITPADDLNYKYSHPLFYFKSAHGLVLLRDVVLGKEKFDRAFKQYVKNWAYKHPRPEDFFRSMDNGSGEDLTWFWLGWYHNNWQLDQAVENVEYIDDEPENGAMITVVNKDQMVMPILLTVEETNGKKHDLKVPVEIWKAGGVATFKVNTTSKIKKVELDPEHQLPDADRSNNIWKP